MRFLRSKRAIRGSLYALDSETAAPINPWESYLKGWFVSRSPSFGEFVLGVLVEGSFVPAVYGLQRPDVARHLNDPSVENSGFCVRFRTPTLARHIELVVEGKDGRTVLTDVDVPRADRAAEIENYGDWLLHREASLFWAEAEVQHKLAALPYRPLISVILPVYNPDRLLLDQCVQSVARQQYADWELCISDDCSSDVTVPGHLATFAAADKRIKLLTAPLRAGIAEAQNRALLKAKGDFVVLLDQHDELHPCALLEVVKRLNELSEICTVVYSDEDGMAAYGARNHPLFKPDFDSDLLIASNYVGRLAAMKRSAVLAAGGFRSAAKGAHEWDMLVRLLERESSGAVQHIAKPLYHRRLGAESNEPAADVRVIFDHIERSAKRAVVEPGIFPACVRLKYLHAPASVAIVIRPEDGDFQLQTVRSLVSHAREISVHPLTSGAAPRADVIVYINRPLETLNHYFVEELVAEAMREECGLTSGISIDLEGRTLHTGLLRTAAGQLIDPFAGIGLLEALKKLKVARAVETVSDEFFAVRRDRLAAVDGLSKLSSSEMPQLVYKLVTNARQHGLRVIVTPFAVAGFHSSAKSKVEPIPPRDGASVSLNPNLLAIKGALCGEFK
jgi:hypothetical protein